MSTWERPRFHPLSLGPRCIRVHGPIPGITITDMTSAQTRRKVMEGTVNRILLRVRAGPGETCRDLKFSVKCSSAMALTEEGPDGPTEKELEDKADPARPPKREPMLVEQDVTMSSHYFTKEGYALPNQWKPRGGDEESDDVKSPITADLGSGETAYFFFDIFRPMPLLPKVGNDSDDLSCWTNYTISLSYNQGRPNRRTDTAITDEDGKGDPVARNVSGSLLWSSPLSAQFSPVQGDQKAYPSGSRHPSNKTPDVDPDSNDSFKSFGGSIDDISGEAVATDGEEVKIRCHLEADDAKDGLAVNIHQISFRTSDKENKSKDQERKYKLSLVVGDGETDGAGVLYAKKDDEVSSMLKAETKFGFVYNVKTELKKAPSHNQTEECEYVRTSLGLIAVDWTPIKLPPIDGNIHGPLSLDTPSTIKFLGPSCYIERAPFRAKLMTFPASPKVAFPFEVKYCIKNQTPYHQKLTLSMSEVHPGDNLDVSDTVLVSGFVNGELQLGPSESRILCYSALAMRAGKTPMPALNVASQRYRSWVINDGQENPRYFYVMP